MLCGFSNEDYLTFQKFMKSVWKLSYLTLKRCWQLRFHKKKINNRISSSITLHEIILITLLFPVSKPPRVVYGGQLISGMFWELIGEIHEITFSPLKRSQWHAFCLIFSAFDEILTIYEYYKLEFYIRYLILLSAV